MATHNFIPEDGTTETKDDMNKKAVKEEKVEFLKKRMKKYTGEKHG